MDDGPPDATLVERTLRGDRQAFDQLTRRYLRPALAAAWEYADSLADAEDLVQESFLKSLESLDRFDRSRPFAPWFFAILRNAARNEAARRGRWQRVPVPDDLADHLDSPEAELDASEIRAALERGAAGLSAMQRACFRLCDVEGFTSSEAGEMLGVSGATVRVHVHRARGALREVLDPLIDERSVR